MQENVPIVEHQEVMNPFNFFDRIYCINLDSRKDRWEQARQEFSSIGILDSVKRFSGITYNEMKDPYWNKCIGCHLSHLELIATAKQLELSNILIFEDDVEFINNTLDTLSLAIDQIPLNWNMFYLGGNICNRITIINRNIGKLSHAQSTHAYAINSNFYDIILNKGDQFWNRHMDVVYSDDLIPYNKCYITIPMIAVQRDTFSDIEGRVVSYRGWMEKRFWEQLS